MERMGGITYFLEKLAKYLNGKLSERTFVENIQRKLEEEGKSSCGSNPTYLVVFFGTLIILNPGAPFLLYSLKVPEEWQKREEWKGKFKDKTKDFRRALRIFARGLKARDKEFWQFFYLHLEHCLHPHFISFSRAFYADTFDSVLKSVEQSSPLEGRLYLEILGGKVKGLTPRSVEILEDYVRMLIETGEPCGKSFYLHIASIPNPEKQLPPIPVARISTWGEILKIQTP
jgi:hypothetical protein